MNRIIEIRKIFRSILVNDIPQSGTFNTVETVQHICDELLKDNIDVLDELQR